jgi:hypothetical protein
MTLGVDLRSAGEFKELMDCWKRFCVLTAADGFAKPKTHLMMHLVIRSAYQGNPWDYKVFEDESLNKLLKAVLRNVSQANFDASTFVKLEASLQHSAKRFRR